MEKSIETFVAGAVFLLLVWTVAGVATVDSTETVWDLSDGQSFQDAAEFDSNVNFASEGIFIDEFTDSTETHTSPLTSREYANNAELVVTPHDLNDTESVNEYVKNVESSFAVDLADSRNQEVFWTMYGSSEQWDSSTDSQQDLLDVSEPIAGSGPINESSDPEDLTIDTDEQIDVNEYEQVFVSFELYDDAETSPESQVGVNSFSADLLSEQPDDMMRLLALVSTGVLLIGGLTVLGS